MTMGNKTVVDAVFADTGSDVFLDGPKRPQGNSVAAETAASVADSVEMTGIPVNGIDGILEEDVVRAEYGPGANAPRSVYRTVERPGEDSDAIVNYLGGVLEKKYGVKMDTVFRDRTSLFFEVPRQGIVRVGYSRDHRPDRPQVTIGSSMDRGSGMPVGSTVNAGNILDVTHFEDTFGQMVLAPERKQEMDVLFRQGRTIRTDGCEDKTPREGNRYEESLHRHGILPKQAKEQEV